MNTGRLRDRLTIQTYTNSIAANGETTKTWTTFATVYAEIRPISGRELEKAGKVQGELTHVIKIRYLSGVLYKMRGVDEKSRVFEFDSVVPDRTNAKDLIITANEKKV